MATKKSDKQSSKIGELQAINKELEFYLDKLKASLDFDWTTASEWVVKLQAKYDNEGDLASEDGAIEKVINDAIKNQIYATDKIPKILDAISKVLSALVKERAFLQVAGSAQPQYNLSDASDRKKLLAESKDAEIVDEDEEEDDDEDLNAMKFAMDHRSIKELDQRVERSIYEEH